MAKDRKNIISCTIDRRPNLVSSDKTKHFDFQNSIFMVGLIFLRHMKSRDTRIFQYLLVVILEGSFANGHIIVSFSIGPNPVKGGGFSRQFGRKSAF